MSLSLFRIKKLYNGTSLTRFNIINLYNTLSLNYKNGDYRNLIEETSSTNIYEIINDHEKLFRVHLNVLKPNSNEIYKFPRYINLLEGDLDIDTTNSKLRLTKGGIYLNEDHTITNNNDKTCVIISHTDLSKSLYDIALL